MRLRLATTRIVAFGLLCAAVIVTLPGCGDGNTPATEEQFRDTNLLDVGELLRMYQIEKGEPPQSFADVQAVPSLEMAAPMGFERIRSGEFIVRWGATLPDTGEEIGTTDDSAILAYVKEAPEQGGSVLLLNRTLTTMTADEFAAAPKAGNDPEE
ncbi:hypothetical protein [Tautonia marina]|uniref:hypothetical protein n=1 Tax=Tautonia marina TaxID=2653855 RepID=UPI0012604D5C|nr:hypothetical protein [Tautonia marina]